MIAHVPRSPGYYTASHWLQGAVVLVLLGSLALGLLWALNDAKERAEKQVVELSLRNMRTGMKMAMGEALMRQREGEMVSWVGINPVLWLAGPPTGYRGECSAEESRNLSAGEWCFERENRVLVYRPRSSDHLRALVEGQSLECSQLSWRVTRVSESAASGGFIGLRIEAASPCRWVLEGT